MYSPTKEYVKFSKPFIAKGNVEDWLQVLETSMKNTMKDIIRECAEECGHISINDLINKYPAQVALLGLQFIWTSDTEEAIMRYKTEKKALDIADERCRRIVLKLTEMTTHKLSQRDRTKIETLVTIQVHQKDVCEHILNRHTRDVQDFEWQRQARFYWKTEKDTCVVWVADVDQEYCYEYLGVKERLVITPLTDRCYITLCQALGMKLGGAPAGPAGTGKTETIKDLGRTIGKYVVVFNCSDQMHYQSMAKIFKGLAQSGAWGDFDEFNRIKLEVLSVVGQQIQTIFSALRDTSSRSFVFTDGTECKLNPGVGIFITMNPGYRGRQELPENLKILFRGVSMMVPDKDIIIRVKLSACGYKQNTKHLAKKFASLYKLCEQQLSKQPHYDFGLRNILSVLRTAGETKRQNKNISDEVLIMSTLKDMNMSKLVAEDVNLFNALIRDLFPDVKPKKRRFKKIEEGIIKNVKKRRLILHKPWFDKVIQLYETSLVRHGIMLVGPSGSGKTSCYHILLKTLSDLKYPHKEFRMNPKAITATQMFGRLLENEWTDGIFSALWKIGNNQKKQTIWLICDGPVDSLWIENLNTVLDDNKLLTLANGDRIKMAETTKMCFEVENLRNANPSTVSRAGQIYMSENVLGWKPVFQSKLLGKEEEEEGEVGETKHKLEKPFNKKEEKIVKQLFEKYINIGMRYVDKNLHPIMEVCEINKVNTCFEILLSLVDEHTPDEADQSFSLEESLLKKLFVFSFIWAFGGLLETDERIKFSKWITDKMKESTPKLEGKTNVFDYFVDVKTKQWKNWSTIVEDWEYPKNDELDFSTVFIPTSDSVRTKYLISKLHQRKKNLLVLGGIGTAKTVTIETYLTSLLNEEDFSSMTFKKINFSSATTPNMLQKNIESVIEKRFRAYGPPGGKEMTIFIDDINMPEYNQWGDQVTNEIVRQLVEFQGFYSLSKPGDWMQIEDIQIISAMSHPGGGKNDIPNRSKRHFGILNVTLPSKNSIDKIFNSIILGRYNSAHPAKFNNEILEVASKLTDSTISLWKTISSKLLPTPSKFHYLFNLRDLSRIFQGIMLCPPEVVKNEKILFSLWKNECERIFSDRLNDPKDKEWLEETFYQISKKFFKEDIILSSAHFLNFLRDPIIDEDTDEIIKEADKIYENSENIEVVRTKIVHQIERYNEFSKIKKLDLVLFDDAVHHLMRISRVLSMKRGNALLVGFGGSGKQSLTRLASFIAGYETRQIVLQRNFRLDDLFEFFQELYKTTGLQGKPLTFLFTDNEIKDETFLEYINMILSSGEINGLFQKEDLDIIINDLRTVAKKEFPNTIGKNDTYDNLYRWFINRVRDNLHVVLSFSPAGDKFRTRARKFPALFSGCTIDWFFPWPENALVQVVQKYLSDFNIHCDEETKSNLFKFMAFVHSSQTSISDEYFQRYRKQVFSTPQSYLNFIKSFQDVYKNKYLEKNQNAEKVNLGLEKLNTAEEDVKKMKLELKEKERNLEIAQKQTDVLMEEIEQKKEVVMKKVHEVEKIKNVLLTNQQKIEKGKNEAEKDLAAAKPALDEAIKSLASITPKDINYLRNLPKPPFLIRYVFDCVLILFNHKILKVERGVDKKKRSVIKDSWEYSKRFMNKPHFLKNLLKFEKDRINDETLELIEPYLQHPDFSVDKIKTVSLAASGICQWVIAMKTYQVVAKHVKPKMAKLRKMEASLKVATEKLNTKEQELAKIQERLDKITEQYEDARKRKQAIEEDAKKTRNFLEKANNLIEALQGEKSRWTKQSNEFKDSIRRLVGDVALSCAFISYCGPFNSDFRKKMLSKYFYSECVKKNIPVTKNLDIIKLLTDEAQRGTWNLEGLPSDEHSVQNAIMVTKSSKYPLLIDPQQQGLKWLTNRKYTVTDKEGIKADKQLNILTFTHKRFRQFLEDSISYGYAMIVENVPEEIDPVLNPVLEQNIITKGKLKQIIIQDELKDYDENFEFYLSTKLARPNFTPELYAKTTVIDFGVTIKGLEEQLLAYVIQKEKAELEEQRESLLKEVNENQKKIKKYEVDLLRELAQSKGNLLENKALIENLAATKKAAQEVNEKLNVARETERRINVAREEYRPVAIRGSVLYFVMVELSLVNPMYQTSLSQFYQLFDISMKNAKKAPLASKRIQNIIETLTYDMFKNVGMGLFKRHKFLFVLLLVCKILVRDGKISHEEFHAFLQGGAALDINTVEKKQVDWLDDEEWKNIIAISNSLDIFKELPQMINRSRLWKIFHDEEKPEKTKIPEINDKLTEFEKLILIRSIRPDRTVVASHDFISNTLGKKFVSPIPLVLEDIANKSKNSVPLICLLSSGSDPTSQIESLAKKQKFDFNFVSMGQGQEKVADELIRSGFENGGWVLLQNCHLSLPFVSGIEDMVENAHKSKSIHPDFRLWMTSEPHEKFPIGLLQMSVKITLEGDEGLDANMKDSFDWISQDMLDASTRPEWRPLLYTMCFLHSIIQERRKFGAIGMNIPYQFNFSDLNASLDFLQNHFASIGDNLKKGPQINWKTLKYMISEIHYGGKITDEFDRLIFKTYVDKWLTSYVANNAFCFYRDESFRYTIPKKEYRKEFMEEIEKFPNIDKPQIFGLHENADISYRMLQGQEVLDRIIEIQPKETSDLTGETREETVKRIANDFLTKLPDDFNKDEVKETLKKKKGKRKEYGPLTIHLSQEIDRLQKLMKCVRETLKDLILAIDGTITMSTKLQSILNSLFDAKVPGIWRKLSWYNSTIGRWFTELIKRHKQLNFWLFKQRPSSFWLTGFYNTTGFLTSVMQEVARSKGWSLSECVMKSEVKHFDKKDITSPPEDGVYIHGLILEGAGWNKSKSKLKESSSKVITVKMPIIHITAVTKLKKRKSRYFPCPVYTNSKRNFDANHPEYICSINLNSGEFKSSHWVLRGTALLLKTD